MNLSPGGAFITGGPPLETGRRVSVVLDLADGKPAIAVHARVAWSREEGDSPERPAGLGVSFVRIDDEATARISTLLTRGAQSPREVLHSHVRVRLPDVSERLRASAREMSSGTLVVESEIGWLQLGAAIATELAPGDVRQGRLSWVSVDVSPSGHARLRLTIETAAPAETAPEGSAAAGDGRPLPA
jgi:Tfp pilus assembly protein PilZ